MSFTTKLAHVIDKNRRITGEEVLLLQHIFFKKASRRQFIAAFSQLAGVASLLLLCRIFWVKNYTIQICLSLTLIIAAVNFLFGIYEANLSRQKKNKLVSHFGVYPEKLEKIVIDNIDSLYNGEPLPTEYYEIRREYFNTLV